MSNIERIRAMSEEELANWYFEHFFHEVPYCKPECPDSTGDCKQCLLAWLKAQS